MVRILANAALQNYHTVRLSLNHAGTQVYASTDRFLRWFCVNVARQVGLESRLDDYWDEDNSALMNSTIYFQGYLLKRIFSPVVLALDEVNQLFDYPDLARDVLALLRSWYEETRDISVWQKLRFVLVCSTEAYIPLPTNRSPFIIGLVISLPSFTLSQVKDLIQRHGLQATPAELDQLMDLTGGYPYLIRLALYQSVYQSMPIRAVLKDAATERSIFSQHLHTQLWHLRQNPDLVEAFQHLLEAGTPIRLEQAIAFKLKSLGLVHLDGNQAVISCGLYKAYFQGLY